VEELAGVEEITQTASAEVLEVPDRLSYGYLYFS
jgi:hypothetical protein